MLYLLLIGVIVIGGVIAAIAGQSETNSLINNFRELGVLKGRTLEEIVKAVGEPQHWSTLTEGTFLYQWHSTPTPGASNYHISLIFKDNICEGVSSESVHSL